MKNEEIVKHLIRHGTTLKFIRRDVSDIKKNHLPHLQKRIDKIMFVILGGAISLIIALVAILLN